MHPLFNNLHLYSVNWRLSDDSLVQGTLERVDGYMNIEMAEAVVSRDTFYDTSLLSEQQEIKEHYDYYFVKGPKIRQIELPENCDDLEHIKDEINRIRNRRLQWTKKDVVAPVKLSVPSSDI